MGKRKARNGQPIRFAVKDAVTGRAIRDDDGNRVQIVAFTQKSAKLQAKQTYGAQVIVEALGT